jgi:hypothetical protein
MKYNVHTILVLQQLLDYCALFQLQQERDDLHNRFVTAILELQQRTGLKNVLLEKKLAAMNNLLEQKQAQINEALAAANLDPAAMATVNNKLEV